ncbi:VOC family protein [Halomonas elongata]|uniref:VOC family protein n=1 Tax=Halomonas elongata TaxID=2746 RepID=UPI0023B065CE|nr:VOC family protein [Halomonas elongata]
MSLGIDHPLVAVHDLEAAADQARRLGFRLNPRHQHPWGTDNYLLFFPENFIELIGIGRPELLDYRDANGFRFGQQVADRLQIGEGIAMLALESEDMARDHQTLILRGAKPPSPIVFRRQAHLPGGRTEEVGVSLDILHDTRVPYLTQFLCQQLRPELFRTDSSLEHHPNTAKGITAVWYVSAAPEQDTNAFRTIHGDQAVHHCEGGYCIETEKGNAYLLTPSALATRFPLLHDIEPHPTRGVALSLACESIATAQAHWAAHDVAWQPISRKRSDIAPAVLGGTLLCFEERSATLR